MKLITIVPAILLASCARCGDVKKVVHVEPAPHYEEATAAAVSAINGFVGCKFLVVWGIESKPDITLSADHSKESPWEARPNINTKACIAAIQIKNALGLPPSPVCLDPATDEQNRIRVRDVDVDVLKARFCK